LRTTQIIDVTAPDGTVVGVERLGSGPPLLAVHGGTADRTRWAPVRNALAEVFTVYLLDRRGRLPAFTPWSARPRTWSR
jgi:pimeloyl-ACP methyl ester carboxylesterase